MTRYMLSDSEAALVLTISSYRSLLPQLSQCVQLDTDTKLWRLMPKTNPNAQIQPQDLLWVIYTSGSTGKTYPRRHLASFR